MGELDERGTVWARQVQQFLVKHLLQQDTAAFPISSVRPISSTRVSSTSMGRRSAELLARIMYLGISMVIMLLRIMITDTLLMGSPLQVTQASTTTSLGPSTA